MIAIPFNFQPSSVSVVTGSYTIPAGKFAYVSVSVTGGAYFTVDGTTALQSLTDTSPDVSDVSVTGVAFSATTYTVPSDYCFEGFVHNTIATSGNVTVAGTQIYPSLTTGETQPIKAADGAAVTINISGSSTGHITGYIKRLAESGSNNTGNFWLPAGTVINGNSSWKAVVSLYDEIS